MGTIGQLSEHLSTTVRLLASRWVLRDRNTAAGRQTMRTSLKMRQLSTILQVRRRKQSAVGSERWEWAFGCRFKLEVRVGSVHSATASSRP